MIEAIGIGVTVAAGSGGVCADVSVMTRTGADDGVLLSGCSEMGAAVDRADCAHALKSARHYLSPEEFEAKYWHAVTI